MGLTWRLLQECWGRQEGWVFLPAKDNGHWLERGSHVWPRDGVVDMTVSLQHDQYFCPLVFSEPRRKAEYALPTHVLWSDLDAADPAQCALRPSAAWKTTQGASEHGDHPQDSYTYDGCPGCHPTEPHWQGLWFLGLPMHSALYDVEAQSQGREAWSTRFEGYTRTPVLATEAAQLSRRIAYAEGADKGGWDVTQVLRLPGTRNHKHNPPHLIELLWAERRYYTIEQIRAAYPPVPVPQPETSQWSTVPPEEVQRAFDALPYGIRLSFERGPYGDRSLELIRLARTLTACKVPPEIIPHLLRRHPNNKFEGRTDEYRRLLTAYADALL